MIHRTIAASLAAALFALIPLQAPATNTPREQIAAIELQAVERFLGGVPGNGDVPRRLHARRRLERSLAGRHRAAETDDRRLRE